MHWLRLKEKSLVMTAQCQVRSVLPVAGGGEQRLLHVDRHCLLSNLAGRLVALAPHAGVVEDDEAGAEHADGVEDVVWLAAAAALSQDLQLLLVQPGVSGLHLLPGLPAQLAGEEGELEEGERGQKVEEMFTQLGGQLGQTGLTFLGVHCPVLSG